MHDCNNQQRFLSIEEDIRELKEQSKNHSIEIGNLRESQSETKVYVKQIFERIDDLKILFKNSTKENNKTWSNIVIKLIEMIGTVAAIIAGIKLLGG